MSVAAVAVAGGSFLFLEYAFPPVQEVVQAPDTVPVEKVFSGQLAAAPAAEVVAAVPVTEDDPDAVSEVLPAEEPVADEPAAMAAPEPQAATESAESMEPATMAPEPEPEPAAMPEPEPEPVTAPPPERTTAMPKSEPAPAKKPAAKPAKPAAPVKAWWGAERADRLSLIFAGSAAYKRAVVLMFNSAFETADAANTAIQVMDGSGKRVSGSWELGANNKRMLLFPVQKAGVYKLVVKKNLADRTGRTMQADLQGPVQVE